MIRKIDLKFKKSFEINPKNCQNVEYLNSWDRSSLSIERSSKVYQPILKSQNNRLRLRKVYNNFLSIQIRSPWDHQDLTSKMKVRSANPQSQSSTNALRIWTLIKRTFWRIIVQFELWMKWPQQAKRTWEQD